MSDRGGSDELLDAIEDLERIEDQLHEADHPLADDVSDVRMRINEVLINEVLEIFD